MKTWIAATLLMVASATASAGTVTYFHNDFAGSPVVATNANREVIWRESYRPYGERLTNAAAANDNKVWFTSRRQDADTGLVHMGARYYDPVLGRFISMDPVGFDEANVHSHSRYSYANNNPFRYKDSDGRSPDTVVDVGFLLYDAGRMLGATAAWLAGNVTGDLALGSAGADGVKEVGLDFGASLAALTVPGLCAPMLRGGIKAAGDVSSGAQEAKRFSIEKEALVEMAKADKKKGITEGDMQAYKDLNRQLPDPFPSNKVRGPESHTTGGAHSQQPHGHVGPIDHIPIR